AQTIGHPSGTSLHVLLVLSFRAYAGDAQEGTQFLQVFFATAVNIFSQIHKIPQNARVHPIMMQRLKTKLSRSKQASGSGRKDPVPRTILGRIGVRVQATPTFRVCLCSTPS